MAIPGKIGRISTPRSVRVYLPGKGPGLTPNSTAATAPQNSSIAQAARTFALLGVSSNSITITIPSVASGATLRLPFNVPFTQLVQLAQGYYTQGDTFTSNQTALSVKNMSHLLFTVTVNADITDTTTTLHIKGCYALATAYVRNTVYTGPLLPSGNTYTSFQAVGTLSVLNSGGSAYAGSATLYASGTLAVAQQ